MTTHSVGRVWTSGKRFLSFAKNKKSFNNQAKTHSLSQTRVDTVLGCYYKNIFFFFNGLEFRPS